uniref:ATP-binding protein n=1 Tax=Caldimicrobium thiodismutans TaxID=1653476 RepID=A0A832GMD2_9BACT
MEYLPRKIEKKLEDWIESPYVIILKGPRQSGKTTLFRHLQAKYGGYYISLEDEEHAKALTQDPLLFVKPFLKGRFLFLDEAQYVKHIGRYLKLLFDHYGERLKILVTGSGSFEIKENLGKYLVGRALYFELFPLSFEEFLAWKDSSLYEVYLHYHTYLEKAFHGDWKSVKEIFISKSMPVIYSKRFLLLLEEFLTFGGYPAIVKEEDRERKIFLLKNLVQTYLERDVFHFLGVRETEKFRGLLKALAFISGSLLENSNLATELKTDFRTLLHYEELLIQSYIINLLPPFYGNLLNELRKTPKVYFLDPGVRNALLGNFLPFNSRTDLGALLENFSFSELKKAGFEVKFWRKASGAEVDFVVLANSRPIPLEVKKKAKVEKSLRSFISAYKPPVALILALEQDKVESLSLGETLLLLCPLYLL